MGNALGKYYVQKAFNDNSKVMAKEIIVNIKQAMADKIPEMTWLDESTAFQVTEILNEMDYKNIGYPDYIFEPKELLVKEYEGFEVDSKVLLNSMLNYIIFSNGKLEVPKDTTIWEMTPQVNLII